jgi:hypothetical protein
MLRYRGDFVVIAGIQYDLFEAEWQMMEEEYRNGQPVASTTTYNYMNDLLHMEKCIPQARSASIVDKRLWSITTPLRSTVGESIGKASRQTICEVASSRDTGRVQNWV